MTSKYTNIVLTIIAVLLATLLLKSNSDFSIAKNVQAQSEKYTQFRAVGAVSYEVDKTIQENVKNGWKPISISQSQDPNRSYADLTIIFGK